MVAPRKKLQPPDTPDEFHAKKSSRPAKSLRCRHVIRETAAVTDRKYGGASRDRTDDLIVANDGVCQIISFTSFDLAAEYGPLWSNSTGLLEFASPLTSDLKLTHSIYQTATGPPLSPKTLTKKPTVQMDKKREGGLVSKSITFYSPRQNSRVCVPRSSDFGGV
jgi:hypothetical protein